MKSEDTGCGCMTANGSCKVTFECFALSCWDIFRGSGNAALLKELK